MHGDAVDGSDASTEIAVDDGAHVAVAQPDVVEIPADLLDVDDALEGDPTSTVEMPLRLRIRDRYPQISRELLTHLVTEGTREGSDMKAEKMFLARVSELSDEQQLHPSLSSDELQDNFRR